MFLFACAEAEPPPISAPAGDPDFLTDKQRKRVVELTQAACAERWCAREYEFQFLGVSCTKATWSCRVGIVGWRDDDKARKKDVQCTVSGVTGHDQILQRKKTSELWNEGIDHCLTDFTVPGPPG